MIRRSSVASAGFSSRILSSSRPDACCRRATSSGAGAREDRLQPLSEEGAYDLGGELLPGAGELAVDEGNVEPGHVAELLVENGPGHVGRVELAWSRTFLPRRSAVAAGRWASISPCSTAPVVAATAPFVLGRYVLVTRAAAGRLHAPFDAYTLRVLRRRLTAYGVDEAMTEAHCAMAG